MVKIMVGKAKVRKLLPESGLPGIAGSLVSTNPATSTTYIK